VGGFFHTLLVAKKKKKADLLKAIADRQAFNARQIARIGNPL
jgi:hypothetical protein